jgi:hypothetical protein
MELSLLFYGLSILILGKNTLYELESLVDTPTSQVGNGKEENHWHWWV